MKWVVIASLIILIFCTIAGYCDLRGRLRGQSEMIIEHREAIEIILNIVEGHNNAIRVHNDIFREMFGLSPVPQEELEIKEYENIIYNI